MSNHTTDVQEQGTTASRGNGQGADRKNAKIEYTPPSCERLGHWSVLTLQQSIVIPP